MRATSYPIVLTRVAARRGPPGMLAPSVVMTCGWCCRCNAACRPRVMGRLAAPPIPSALRSIETACLNGARIADFHEGEYRLGKFDALSPGNRAKTGGKEVCKASPASTDVVGEQTTGRAIEFCGSRGRSIARPGRPCTLGDGNSGSQPDQPGRWTRTRMWSPPCARGVARQREEALAWPIGEWEG